jgi:hypothetical protein
MNTLETTATEINRLHQQAHASAESAVAYAKAAGKLLLEAKSSIKHGEFRTWIEANLTVSVRQAQRYMAAAQGKPSEIRNIFTKSDMVSHLPPAPPRSSMGVWKGERWIPEPGYLYCLSTDNDNYWVAPAQGGYTHVSKLYSGDRMSTDGFIWRYTIFSKCIEADLPDQWYVGTRYPPLSRSGIHGILESYGLHDFQAAKIKSFKCDDPFDRPFGEPDPEHWYWDEPLPDDDFYLALEIEGLLNKRGVPLLLPLT